MPLYPEMLRTKEHAPTLSPSIVFIFGLAVESIKELESGQHIYLFMVNG
jgi:hypothetical protein